MIESHPKSWDVYHLSTGDSAGFRQRNPLSMTSRVDARCKAELMETLCILGWLAASDRPLALALLALGIGVVVVGMRAWFTKHGRC
jgi:hypothetical protein